MNKSYVEQYSKIGMETGVASADPHRLILMLLEGAIASTAFAKNEMQRGHLAAKGEAISKAINIIGELDLSLNMDVGGEIAENLRRLYDYMSLQLVDANLHDDEKKLDQVVQILTELKAGWVGITDEVRKTAQAQNLECAKETVSYGAV